MTSPPPDFRDVLCVEGKVCIDGKNRVQLNDDALISIGIISPTFKEGSWPFDVCYR